MLFSAHLALAQTDEIFRLDWSTAQTDVTLSVAWGDYDGDGDLDLAVGNIGPNDNSGIPIGQPNRVYQNDDGVLTLVWSSLETDKTTSVAWGDYDADGDLDLAVGNWGEVNRVYENHGGSLAFDLGSGLWLAIRGS